ncbi:MAG TPA: response regulator transcription factor [Thermomicrobiaceae bacterium]|nr:response regulator transcription factor [Thermomicrobiaceae bacterium]
MAQVNPMFEHPRTRMMPANGKAKAIGVLLVDDHVLFRQALRHLLESEPDIRVVGEAGDGRSAEALATRDRPDVILMDISMPGIDGVSATRELKSELPTVKIIILTMFAEDAHVIRAIRAGADAYLLKNTESVKVIDAIRAVARGESVIEPQLATKLLSEFRRISEYREEESVAGLTEREVQLLRLVASGLSNKEIASELNLAESTVKNRLSVLFEKLDVKDRTQAAIYALSHGLITKKP